MRPALAAVLLLALVAGAAASDETYRLEIKASGKAALSRPGPQGDLSIEIPADFQAMLNLIRSDDGWIARDADIKLSLLGQTLRLRLTAPPDEQVYIEVNNGPAGWGSRRDLGAVPLLGTPFALGPPVPDDPAWRLGFQPVPAAQAAELSATLGLPGGGELLRFPVTLAAQEPAQAERTWSASGRLGPIQLPAPDHQTVVVNHLAWTGQGQIGAAPQPFAGKVTLEAEFLLPGSSRGTLEAQAEAALVPGAPEAP